MLHPYVGDLSSLSVMLSLKSRVVDWHTQKVRRAPLPVLAQKADVEPAFVKIVQGDLRNDLNCGKRARQADFPCDE